LTSQKFEQVKDDPFNNFRPIAMENEVAIPRFNTRWRYHKTFTFFPLTLRQNKLECLSPERFFSGLSHICVQASALLPNITLAIKTCRGKNALAYSAAASVTTKKFYNMEYQEELETTTQVEIRPVEV